MSHIDDLEKNLYSRNEPVRREKTRMDLTRIQTETSMDWNDDDVKQPSAGFWLFREGSFFKLFLVGALTFFIASVAIATYVFYGGFGVISSKNVDIKILGPVSISGGEELALDIVVENQNNVDLESADLFIEYPLGARNVDDPNKELTRVTESIGAISAGGIVKKTYRSVLFGQKDEVKQIKVSVEYRIKNSNAIFAKDKTFDVSISSAPLLLSVEYPNEVQSSQDVEFRLVATSNSRADLSNLILRAEYPFGFTFTSATPNPSIDQNIWKIGTIKPEEKKTIVVRGRLQALENEERTVRFSIGTESPQNEKAIQNELALELATLAVKRPGITLGVSINGSEKNEYITSSGKKLEVGIDWFNSLPTDIRDASIEVSFSGSALDRNSVSASDGFFRSSDNTIIWNKETDSSFRSLSPGEKDSTNFNFSTSAFASDKTPFVNMVVTMRGTRISSGGVPEQVISSASKKIKIQSYLSLFSSAVYNDGPFLNTGLIPPRVEKPTTYTITWSVTNLFNDVARAEVRARLPAYVTWTNSIYPPSSNITYNSSTREVVWVVGDVKAGAGYGEPANSTSFQVSFLPSLSQVDTSPVLVDDQVLKGTDRFTLVDISENIIPVTTNITNDSKYDHTMGKVAR